MSRSIAMHSKFVPLIFSALCASTATLATRSASAADDSCKPVFDAITRLVKTPNHQYVSQSDDAPGNLPRASEMVSTTTATYLLMDGKWQMTKATAEEMLKRDEENRKNSKTSCRFLRDESVDGVSAAVYSLHSESGVGQSEGQIWISKASALPVHQKIDLALDGKTGKTHVETRFAYSDVVAPAGVK